MDAEGFFEAVACRGRNEPCHRATSQKIHSSHTPDSGVVGGGRVISIQFVLDGLVHSESRCSWPCLASSSRAKAIENDINKKHLQDTPAR
jgi:hypothetical protein